VISHHGIQAPPEGSSIIETAKDGSGIEITVEHTSESKPQLHFYYSKKWLFKHTRDIATMPRAKRYFLPECAWHITHLVNTGM
jgi:hypothetical protein